MFTDEFEKLESALAEIKEQIKEHDSQRKVLVAKRKEIEGKINALNDSILAKVGEPSLTEELLQNILTSLPRFEILGGEVFRRDYLKWFKENFEYTGNAPRSVENRVRYVYNDLRKGRHSLESLNCSGELFGKDNVESLLQFYNAMFTDFVDTRGIHIFPFRLGLKFIFCDNVEKYLEKLNSDVNSRLGSFDHVKVPALKGKYFQDSVMFYLLHFYYNFENFEIGSTMRDNEENQFASKLAKEHAETYEKLLDLLNSKA